MVDTHPPSQPASPATRTRRGLVIGLVAGGAALILVVGAVCLMGAVFYIGRADDAGNAPSESVEPGAPTRPDDRPTSVRLEVTGTGTATLLVYSDGDPATAPVSRSEVPLPWSETVPCCEEFDYAIVAASASPEPVTCRILDGETVLDEQTAAGSVDCRWVAE